MRKYKLWMRDIVFTDDFMFFSSGQFNGLFRTRIHSSEAEFIGFFPNDSKIQARLHSNAFQYKDEILFLPDLSDYITLYNIKKNDFVCMKFPVENSDSAMKFIPKTVVGILYGSCVYAFGGRYPCIVCYDFETRRLKVYDEGFETYKRYGYKDGMVFFSPNVCQMGNAIFIGTYTDDVIAEFNPKTGKSTFYHVGKLLSNVLCSELDRIWLIDKSERCIYAWNTFGGILQSLEIKGDLDRVQQDYQYSAILGNEIWFFPYLSGLIMTVDKQSGRRGIKELFKKSIVHQNKLLGAVWFCKVHENKLYFMSVSENKLYCFNSSNEQEFCMDIYTDRTILMELIFHDFDWCGVKKEMGNFWKIEYGIIDEVMLDSREQSKKETSAPGIGKIIYDYLLKP